MSIGSIFLFIIIGTAIGSVAAFLLGGVFKRRDLKAALRDDDAVIRDFYARSKRIRMSAGGDTVLVRKFSAAAERLLDMTVEIIASIAAEPSVGSALEYEAGVRMTLGTAKGLLDAAEALVLPAAAADRRNAGELLASVEGLRRLIAGRIARCRVSGLWLEAEAARVSMLRNALEADQMLVGSDPAQAVAVLSRQIGVLNEVLAEIELKEAVLPQA